MTDGQSEIGRQQMEDELRETERQAWDNASWKRYQATRHELKRLREENAKLKARVDYLEELYNRTRIDLGHTRARYS